MTRPGTGPMRGAALALLIALALATGCARNRDTAGDQGEETRALPVVVASLAASSIEITVDLSGSTEAVREVDIAAEVGGTVTASPLRLGDPIAEGELILRVDPRPFRAGVAQAEAALVGAEAGRRRAARELERATALKAKDRISDVEFEAAELLDRQTESGLLAARATLEQASFQLERSELRAPFAGRIARIAVEVGEQIAPGLPVAAVVDLGAILVKGSVADVDAVRLRAGMPVGVTVPALGEERFAGRVRAVGVRSDPLTRSYPIEIEVPNPESRILSGMAVRCAVIVSRRENVIAVPMTAVVEQFGEPVVFVVEENTARRRPVRLGRRAGDRVIVEEGLAAGERLIVKGQWSVRDGSAVEVTR